MSSTILERSRALHEELERIDRMIMWELKRPQKAPRESVQQSHRINNLLMKSQQAADRLARVYEDPDGSRREEIASIAGSGMNLLSIFYDRVREIKEYHRKYQLPKGERLDEILIDEVTVQFTAQEAHGRYLDMHALFIKYNNLSGIAQKIDYETYLKVFREFGPLDISYPLRFRDAEYKEYLTELENYLLDFVRRSQPLFDIDVHMNACDEEFATRWAQGALALPDAVKRNPLKTVEAKDPNAKNPLYCVICKKLFAKETVLQGHLQSKKHTTAAAVYSPPNLETARKETVHTEYRIGKLAELLIEQVEDTRQNVIRKQTLTLEQIYAEQEEHDEERDEDTVLYEEDDDEPIKLTKKNYPVGWDGKPIPFWLYKLHGLGIEYKCEICGNYSYWGRKAFEKHFQEWRHAYGMNCLGIPNTRAFQDITSIKDAVALWQKVRKESAEAVWRPDHEEEYEDADGTVMNKKTYEDLVRQGIL